MASEPVTLTPCRVMPQMRRTGSLIRLIEAAVSETDSENPVARIDCRGDRATANNLRVRATKMGFTSSVTNGVCYITKNGE